MYNYELSYYSYEDSQKYLLQSKSKYTKIQFENLVAEVGTDLILKAHKILKERNLDTPLEIVQMAVRLTMDNLGFSDIITYIKDILISDYGFEEITVEATVQCDGWNSLLNDKNNYSKKTAFEKTFKRMWENKK